MQSRVPEVRVGGREQPAVDAPPRVAIDDLPHEVRAGATAVRAR